MDYNHLPRKIEDPYWGNQNKTQVICKFNYIGGPIVTAAVSDTKEGNPDWQEIMSKWTISEIDKLTEAELKKDNEERQKHRENEKDMQARMKTDELFQAKLEAFEIEEIKMSQNRDLKSKIRKSKNMMEVTAYSAALIALEQKS